MESFPEARIMRSEALQWWGLLPPEERYAYCEIHYGAERHLHSLTGREIERIYILHKD